MKVATAVLIALCYATVFENGCGNSSNTFADQNLTVNSNTRSQDIELLKNIEQFAGGGSESAAAWLNLMKHDRAELIKNLTRISEGLPAEDRNRVLIAYTFCKMRHDNEPNRKILLAALSKNPPYKNLYGDWVVTMMSDLMVDGDTDLLMPLFQSSEWSDGAMSTDLSYAYSQALLKNPESFLKQLSKQPQNNRDSVISLLRDYSLTPEQKKKIEDYLRTVRPPSNLASLAAKTLKALSN